MFLWFLCMLLCCKCRREEYGSSVADVKAWGNTSWSVRPVPHEVTVDAKHMHPLNLIRMYLGYIEEFKNMHRIIFMDDDIIVQKDISKLYNIPLPKKTALSANCHKWYFSKLQNQNHKNHLCKNVMKFMCILMFFCWYRYRTPPQEGQTEWQWHYEYGTPAAENLFLRFDGQTPARVNDMVKRLNMVAKRIDSTLPRVEEVPYFNFGLTLVDLDTFRREKIAENYQEWIRVNYEKRWFSETSLQFGLGLPFLGFLGHVSCHPKEIDVPFAKHFFLQICQKILSRGIIRFSICCISGGLYVKLLDY